MTGAKTDNTRTTPASASRSILLAALLLGALAWLVLVDQGSAPAARELELPALPVARRSCSAPPEAAELRAREAEAAADAKLPRYPYAPDEGIRALQLWSEAESCYRRAGQLDAARRTAALARQIHTQLSHDYHARRLRLLRARQTGDHAAALQELRALSELLRPSGAEAALRVLRRLELTLERETNEEER